jgi:hypothetical protein
VDQWMESGRGEECQSRSAENSVEENILHRANVTDFSGNRIVTCSGLRRTARTHPRERLWVYKR